MNSPFSSAPQTGTFTNVIQPQGVYSPTQTQQAVNSAVAHAQKFADPRWAQKQFLGPGRSADAGTLSAAMPSIGEALSQASQAKAEIPLSDMFSNQTNLLAGETARDTESLGLSNLLSRLNNDQVNNKVNWWNTLSGPLMGYLTGNLL